MHIEATTRHSAVGGTEMADWEQPFHSVLGCLLQAGLLAARYGYAAQAEVILRPVEAARPAHLSTKLARGLAGIYQDKHQEAIDFLDREVLREQPGHDMARAIKALALYHLGRREECRALVKDLLDGKNAASVGPQARNLAVSLYTEVGPA